MGKSGPEKIYDARINLHLSADLKRRIAAAAVARGEGLNEFVRAVLEREFGADRPQDAPSPT